MIGPVFSLEWLQASRRGRHHLFRWAYGGWLLLELAVLYLLYRSREVDLFGRGHAGPGNASDFLTSLLGLVILQQLLLLVLVVPALVAGSVTDEKTRGTLQNLLTSPLSSWEIIAGKLLAQVAQVGLLALAALPLLAFFGALAGLEPIGLAALAAVTLLLLLALAAAAVLASVWCRSTVNALLSTYAVGTAAIMTLGLAGGLDLLNPLPLLQPAGSADGAEWARRLELAAVLGLLALPCVALAVWRLRPAFARQRESRGQQPRSFLERPPVGDQPLRWKEHYAGEQVVHPLLRRLPRRLGIVAVMALTALGGLAVLAAHLPPLVGVVDVLGLLMRLDLVRLGEVLGDSKPSGLGFLMLGTTAALVVGLLAGVRAAVCISGERERQTWDALLATPLTAKQIVRGKLWGVIDACRPYLRAYLVTAVVLALPGGVPAVLAVVFGWGAAWVLMYFLAAEGLAVSARSPSTWRSLLLTLTLGTRDVFVRYVTGGVPFGGMVLVVLVLLGKLPGGIFTLLPALLLGSSGAFSFVFAFLLASGVMGAVLIFSYAEQLLTQTEQRLDANERIPQPGTRIPDSRRARSGPVGGAGTPRRGTSPAAPR